ncbi:MAG: HIG1 domain-containing protein [Gammaproteobacteria bacterium]
MDLLFVVILLAMCATIGVLLLGLIAMASSESTSRIVSTPLMWARIGLQTLTLVLLIVAVYLSGG